MSCRQSVSAKRAAHGFTLIEALVALTLLALLSGALMPLFQQGLAVLERGERRTRAVILAQSLLEEHAVGDPADSPGGISDASGNEGDFAWQITRESYDSAGDGGPTVDVNDPGIALVRVSAGVRWEGGAGGVRLSTLVLERVE